MLVRLTSSAAGEMIMFAEHARRLFDIIGKEGTARGVFTQEQLPEAIAKLHQAVDEEKQALLEAERKMREEGIGEDEKNIGADNQASADKSVHLSQRAYPLIHMMELTQKEDGFILWEADKDF